MKTYKVEVECANIGVLEDVLVTVLGIPGCRLSELDIFKIEEKPYTGKKRGRPKGYSPKK